MAKKLSKMPARSPGGGGGYVPPIVNALDNSKGAKSGSTPKPNGGPKPNGKPARIPPNDPKPKAKVKSAPKPKSTPKPVAKPAPKPKPTHGVASGSMKSTHGTATGSIKKATGKPGLVAGATAAENKKKSVSNGGSSYAKATAGMTPVTVNAVRPNDGGGSVSSYSGSDMDSGIGDFLKVFGSSMVQNGMTGTSDKNSKLKFL